MVARSSGGTRKPERSRSASGRSWARSTSVTTATLAVPIPASAAAASGATSASSRAAGAGGRGEHDLGRPRRSRRGWSGPTVSAQPDAVRRSARTVADVRTSKPPSCTQQAGQSAHPAGQRREDRRGRRRHGSGLLEQAAAPRHREQLRHRGSGRDAAGVAGVHPAEQRLDEPVDELVAQAGGDQVAHGHVVGDGGVGLVARAGQSLGAEHPADGQLVEVERHAHERARHRPQRATGPDGGARRGRVDEVGPERGGEGDPLGATREHRLRTHVDGEAGDLRAAKLAAEHRGALQEQHVAPGRGEVARRDQSGDSPTDDHHVAHVTSLGGGCT